MSRASPSPTAGSPATERGRPARDEFARMLAHEMEGSLIVIANHVTALLDDPSLSAEQLDHAVRIARSTERMRGVIGSVRDLAAGGRTPQRSSVGLDELLGDALDALEPLIDERAAKPVVIADTLPLLTVDRVQIGQLLVNLLGNAIKFGPRGGRVEIRVVRRPQAWRIAISDQGPGIDPADRERIYEPFVRLGSAAGIPGAGLGLALARQLAEDHGGTLVTQAGRPGATFVLTLPDPASVQA